MESYLPIVTFIIAITSIAINVRIAMGLRQERKELILMGKKYGMTCKNCKRYKNEKCTFMFLRRREYPEDACIHFKERN